MIWELIVHLEFHNEAMVRIYLQIIPMVKVLKRILQIIKTITTIEEMLGVTLMTSLQVILKHSQILRLSVHTF